MQHAKFTFISFSILFEILYGLMIWMFWEELKTEELALARALDMGIITLGIVFMGLQARMIFLVGDRTKMAALKRWFQVAAGVWFFLEVVLSYWWCFVTGADPLTEHTPFVVLLLFFLLGQYWALGRLRRFA